MKPDLLPHSLPRAQGVEESFRQPSAEEVAGDDVAGVAGRKDSRPSLDWEQELLTRLVALNHERAAEDRNGLVRWLRPEFDRFGGRPCSVRRWLRRE